MPSSSHVRVADARRGSSRVDVVTPLISARTTQTRSTPVKRRYAALVATDDKLKEMPGPGSLGAGPLALARMATVETGDPYLDRMAHAVAIDHLRKTGP